MLPQAQKRLAGQEGPVDTAQHQLRNPRGDRVLRQKSPLRARLPVRRKSEAGAEVPSDQLEGGVALRR